MRWPDLLLRSALVLGGCAHHGEDYPAGTTAPTAGTSPKSPAAIVTPAQSETGRIASVNPTARHVVVTYPVGVPLPSRDSRLSVYRAGLKVAEIKVSKERIDVNLVADIVAGECQVGDEVRQE